MAEAEEEDAGADLAGLRDAVERLAMLAPADRRSVVERMPRGMARTLHDCWPLWAHPGQLPERTDWDLWLIRAGRGFGKTRAGSEWVQAYARANVTARIALVGGSIDDVRQVMVEGPSGLLATAWHGEAIVWRRDAGEVHFASGAKAFVYSASAPDKLRGPEHHAAWCDELAKWRWGDATWDNLMLGLRLGERPQVVVTTTPQPTVLMRRVMATPGAVETRGRTADNLHLSAGVRARYEAMYAGSRLGRQELDGELVEDLADALWTRALLERQRVAAAPALVRVVVGVDPPAGSARDDGGDACGIVCVALGEDGHGYVVEDASVSGQSPEGWARAVAACAERLGADRVVVEKNQGGDMVESVLRAVAPTLPIRLVHAVRAKGARAEPVAALYEAKRVFHVGNFAALEDELCGMTPAGYRGASRSPDRADALVWAVAALMLGRTVEVGVRAVG
ncbi:terminase family protein [Sphingomonas sp. KR1UV-12]|uniref:Terminase family protein n=1 Tax=Sphingomonas aurea TaxID=3063994 RepID=A0ABT9ELE7_9SPHN|nr:terminase family protein [Sphingomonas sp. KR1UV-12]MDP1027795.1 terminase family protein [Sphingomonas sp. KR1UV-12]